MSNRTLVELNHDYCPREEKLLDWAKAMRYYMSSGDPKLLPQGVEFKHFRHHSEPEPLTELRAKLKLFGRAMVILKGLDISVEWELAPAIKQEISDICKEFEALSQPKNG